jgi:succinate dehydrogenase/fumarate reductase flavoprotein subunit
MSDADVIVVGFGYGGGLAAIAAADAGARVLLIEKNEGPGGISVCSAGGLRIARDPAEARAYLLATNAGTTPEPLMARLAEGMVSLPQAVAPLCAAAGAEMGLRDSPANYPLPGYRTFGFAYVDALDGFDPAAAFPAVRGSPAGARLFEVVRRNVALRPRITVRTGLPAERLIVEGGRVRVVLAGGQRLKAARGVVLACGGFEADAALQAQVWPAGPMLSAAVRFNTGDGIRMGQAAGAALWHLWHLHGSYGFRHPDPAYPFGIRLKRLPDWNPAEGLRENVTMGWILLDRQGRRFANEYDPYMQDTGHRAMETFDPVTQTHPRIPALLLTDAPGRARYPLSAPTWHDPAVAASFGHLGPRDFDAAILTEAPSLAALAERFGLDPATVDASVAAWNRACADGADPLGRPPGSMAPIAEPPFSAAPVWPVVSNTQGGLAHDADQRALDPFGTPIPGLWVAGEIGSVFGHLYMSGGNIAECFVGGRIAGEAAARATFDSAETPA